eukprot:m.275869 g.275869  ORF g.275869 m.275869 type:complete len:326 (+) comp19762_c0_seq88:2764-3741(+)
MFVSSCRRSSAVACCVERNAASVSRMANSLRSAVLVSCSGRCFAAHAWHRSWRQGMQIHRSPLRRPVSGQSLQNHPLRYEPSRKLVSRMASPHVQRGTCVSMSPLSTVAASEQRRHVHCGGHGLGTPAGVLTTVAADDTTDAASASAPSSTVSAPAGSPMLPSWGVSCGGVLAHTGLSTPLSSLLSSARGALRALRAGYSAARAAAWAMVHASSARMRQNHSARAAVSAARSTARSSARRWFSSTRRCDTDTTGTTRSQSYCAHPPWGHNRARSSKTPAGDTRCAFESAQPSRVGETGQATSGNIRTDPPPSERLVHSVAEARGS